MSELTQKQLKELLHYDPEIGVFTWVNCPNKSIAAGIEAGSFNGRKYIQIQIDGRKYKAHQLAWLYMKGYFPVMIDHIDRINWNNKWCNLRKSCSQFNSRNSGNHRSNTSGVKGVSWHKQKKKWAAYITAAGTRKHLGSYEDFYSAVAARYREEQRLHWEEVDSASPAYNYIKKDHIEKEVKPCQK